MQERVKVVLDSNVLISFLLTSNETTSKIMDFWSEGILEVYYSEETFRELEIALDYPRLKARINEDSAQALLDKLKVLGFQIQPENFLNGSRDPKDNKFIQVAKAANA